MALVAYCCWLVVLSVEVAHPSAAEHPLGAVARSSPVVSPSAVAGLCQDHGEQSQQEGEERVLHACCAVAGPVAASCQGEEALGPAVARREEVRGPAYCGPAVACCEAAAF